MAFTVANLKDDLAGLGGGTSTDDIANLNNLINRSARQVLLDTDPPETIRLSSLTNLFSEVYLATLPSDLKGNKIIAIRRQAINANELGDNFSQRYIEDFGLYKSDNTIAIEPQSGTKYLRVSKALTAPVTIESINAATDNGTWAVSGTGSGLAEDKTVFVQSSSLRFNVAGSGTASLTNSTFNQVDLSDHEDISTLFLWVFVPDADNLTSVKLTWGSSSTATWDVTATTQHNSIAFKDGWNLVSFDWASATETGSPDASAIDYAKIDIAHTGADNNYRVDNLRSIRPVPFEIVYYSKFLFSASGTFAETVTDDNDTINLDTDGYNVLVDCCDWFAQEQVKGKAHQDTLGAKQKYQDGFSKYNSLYPSQYEKPKTFYYRI